MIFINANSITHVYIKDTCFLSNFVLFFTSIIKFLFIIILSLIILPIINWINKKYIEIDMNNITNNIQTKHTLYTTILILVYIIIYKLIIVFHFGNNLTYNDGILISTIILTCIALVAYSYFKEVDAIFFKTCFCVYSLICSIIIIDIFSSSYIVITCRIYSSQLTTMIFPVSYSCNLKNDTFVLHIYSNKIEIKQINIHEYIQNKSLEKYFNETHSFFLECTVANNRIIKQIIYDNKGNIQHNIPYTDHMLVNQFTKVI